MKTSFLKKFFIWQILAVFVFTNSALANTFCISLPATCRRGADIIEFRAETKSTSTTATTICSNGFSQCITYPDFPVDTKNLVPNIPTPAPNMDWAQYNKMMSTASQSYGSTAVNQIILEQQQIQKWSNEKASAEIAQLLKGKNSTDGLLGSAIPIKSLMSKDEILALMGGKNGPLDLNKGPDYIKAYIKTLGMIHEKERELFGEYLQNQQQINRDLSSQVTAALGAPEFSKSSVIPAISAQEAIHSGNAGGAVSLDQELGALAGDARSVLQTVNVYDETTKIQFQTTDPQTLAKLNQVNDRLISSRPESHQQQMAKDLGFKSLKLADINYASGDQETGQAFLTVATTLTDIALGFIPIVGPAKDLYEAVSGESILTGEQLSDTARIIAGVGALTLGAAGIVKGGIKLAKAAGVLEHLMPAAVGRSFGKVVDSAAKLGFKSADEIKRNVGIVERWSSSFNFKKIEDASNINAKIIEKGMQPAYKQGTKIVEFETTAADSWVRVHGDTNQVRSWIMRESDIKGLSGKQVAEKFNIPDMPTIVSRVDIPPGTTIRVGVVGSNKFGSSEGATQFEILMDRVPPEWFTKIGGL